VFHAGATLQIVLELSGTFVFGLNGALTAMGGREPRHRGGRRVGTDHRARRGHHPRRAHRFTAPIAFAAHFGPFPSVVLGAIAVTAAALCFAIRMLGVHFNLNVPVSHAGATAKPGSTSEEDA